MARIRYIKHGFFINEQLADCQPLTRLLFAGLWTIADREGRLEDRPRKIKIEILPYDNCNGEDLIAELATAGFLIRYESEGKKYIQIVNFTKHQQPHYKELPSQIPPPPGWEPDTYVALPITEKQRERIYDRDGRKCLECGKTEKLSIDHIIPTSKGGSSDDDNLRTLCHSCNSSKGNRDAASFSKRTENGRKATSAQAQSNVGSTSAQRRNDESGASPSGMGNGEWGMGNFNSKSSAASVSPSTRAREPAVVADFQKAKLNGKKSRFDEPLCREYVDFLVTDGRSITNPGGLAHTLYTSGESDHEIQAWIDNGKQIPKQKRKVIIP